MNLVKRWAILALAFWLTTFIVSGIQIQSGAWNYFWVAALFGVINTILGSTQTLYASSRDSHIWSFYLRYQCCDAYVGRSLERCAYD